MCSDSILFTGFFFLSRPMTVASDESAKTFQWYQTQWHYTVNGNQRWNKNKYKFSREWTVGSFFVVSHSLSYQLSLSLSLVFHLLQFLWKFCVNIVQRVRRNHTYIFVYFCECNRILMGQTLWFWIWLFMLKQMPNSKSLPKTEHISIIYVNELKMYLVKQRNLTVACERTKERKNKKRQSNKNYSKPSCPADGVANSIKLR